MIRIRLRYLLAIPVATMVVLFAIWISSLDLPQLSTHSQIRKKPNLPAGFYLVLETRANKLPEEVPSHIVAQQTYIGPLQNIRECHQKRVTINPLYPGIAYSLVKLDTT